MLAPSIGDQEIVLEKPHLTSVTRASIFVPTKIGSPKLEDQESAADFLNSILHEPLEMSVISVFAGQTGLFFRLINTLGCHTLSVSPDPNS